MLLGHHFTYLWQVASSISLMADWNLHRAPNLWFLRRDDLVGCFPDKMEASLFLLHHSSFHPSVTNLSFLIQDGHFSETQDTVRYEFWLPQFSIVWFKIMYPIILFFPEGLTYESLFLVFRFSFNYSDRLPSRNNSWYSNSGIVASL